jgi:ribosomal protein S18 acetylase RimI-like enzyme
MTGPEVFSLRPVTSSDWLAWRAIRLEALREAPSAFGATLADWQGEGDAELRWRDRLDAVALNVIASDATGDVGQISGIAPGEEGSAAIISLWVAPAARGRGLGELLIGAVAAWAKEQGATSLALDVKHENTHAIGLYRRAGFADAGPNPHDASERVMRLTLR